MSINVSGCTFTIELDKELEKLTEAISTQAAANLKTAEALHLLAQKTLMVPSAPMLHIGAEK